MNPQLAEAFPPGEYLADELEARHWSQSDFAEILGRPAQFVSEIISGKKEITRESAAQIGAALGTSAEMWLNLQNSFLLEQQNQSASMQHELDEVKRRARLNELAPISVLKKRGLIHGTSIAEQEDELKNLYQLPNINDDPVFLTAARRANPESPLTPTQLAWLACARRQARDVTVEPYNLTGLAELAPSIAGLLKGPEAFAELPQVLGGVGVRLVYLEAFPSSKLNGASFLLDDDPGQPVVALSGRGRRLDKVLFTLLHELAHLVRGDVRPDQMLIDEGASHTLGDEKATNELAGEWAISEGLPIPPKPVRQRWVQEQADLHGVHPIVVIGRLQNSGQLDWRTQLVKGAPTVTEQLEKWKN